MPDGPPLLTQERFGRRPPQARLQGRHPGDLVDLHHPVEASQVEADHAGDRGAVRRQTTDHGRPTGEGHHGDPPVRTQPEDRDHLVVVTGVHHEIGRIAGVARTQPQDVRGGVPARVLNPCGIRVGDVSGTDDRRDLLSDTGTDDRSGKGDRRRVDAGVGVPAAGERSRRAGQFGGARRVPPSRPAHLDDGYRGLVGHPLVGHRAAPGAAPPVGGTPPESSPPEASPSASVRTTARTTSSAICSSLRKLSGMSMRE